MGEHNGTHFILALQELLPWSSKLTALAPRENYDLPMLTLTQTHSQHPAPAKDYPSPDGSLTNALHARLNVDPVTSAVLSTPDFCVHRIPGADGLNFA